MKKPKRRYTHPNQITVDIHKARKKIEDLLNSAATLENIAKQSYARSCHIQAAFDLEKARKLRVTATNLEEKKIPYLIQKMAEMNTLPIPGFLPDESVEA